MDDRSSSPKFFGRASGGGFRRRNAAGGFLMSLKSLLWPAGTEPMAAGTQPMMASHRAPVELPASPLQMLSAMPQAPVAERPAPRTFPSTAEAHPLRRVAGSAGRWKKRLAEAKETWPRATVAELVATDGHVKKLTGLIQECYSLDHDTAERQVIRFLGARDARL